MKNICIPLIALVWLSTPQWSAACSIEPGPEEWTYHRLYPQNQTMDPSGIFTFRGSIPGPFATISRNISVEVTRISDQTSVSGQLEPGPAESWIRWVPDAPLTIGETYALRTLSDVRFGEGWELDAFEFVVGAPPETPAVRDYVFEAALWEKPIQGDCIPGEEFPCGGCERELLGHETRWQMHLDLSVEGAQESSTVLVRVGVGVDVDEALQIAARTPFEPVDSFDGQYAMIRDGSALARWPSLEACTAISVATTNGTIIFEGTQCTDVPDADPNALLGRGPVGQGLSDASSGGCSAVPGSNSHSNPLYFLALSLCFIGIRRRPGGQPIALFTALLVLSGCGYGNTDDDFCLPGLTCDRPPIVNPPVQRGRALPELKQAEIPPAPISGGTMATTRSGSLAVVAAPTREKVFIVSLDTRQTLASIAFDGEPGRVHIDAQDQFAYVANRRGSTVMKLNLHHPGEYATLDVCQSPRGLAVDNQGQLHVACQTGIFQIVHPGSGEMLASFFIQEDLRDVIISHGRIFVTRFRSAELLEINRQGETISRRTPPELTAREEAKPTRPNVAWRTIALDDGRLLMLHQRAQLTAVDIVRNPAKGGYGSIKDSMCNESIVQSALTIFELDGSAKHLGIMVGAVLATDVAFNPSEQTVLVGSAGGSLHPFGAQRSAGVAIELNPPPVEGGDNFELPATCLGHSARQEQPKMTGEVASVAFTETIGMMGFDQAAGNLIDFNGDTIVQLSTEAVFDTGHDLFHKDAGAGIACASCHPEGRDDGHTWLFTELGLRRTQSLRGGLKGTEPFHWEGDMPDFGTLAREVMGHRMGGPQLNDAYSDAMLDWLDTLPATAVRPVEQAAVDRGQRLFHDGVVGCASCHSGAQLTNNLSYDVGTGGIFQVPSLKGIVSRAPFMHDGCADSLEARFTNCGGGDAHGQTSHLDGDDIADLVAYMKTL